MATSFSNGAGEFLIDDITPAKIGKFITGSDGKFLLRRLSGTRSDSQTKSVSPAGQGTWTYPTGIPADRLRDWVSALTSNAVSAARMTGSSAWGFNLDHPFSCHLKMQVELFYLGSAPTLTAGNYAQLQFAGHTITCADTDLVNVPDSSPPGGFYMSDIDYYFNDDNCPDTDFACTADTQLTVGNSGQFSKATFYYYLYLGYYGGYGCDITP